MDKAEQIETARRRVAEDELKRTRFDLQDERILSKTQEAEIKRLIACNENQVKLIQELHSQVALRNEEIKDKDKAVAKLSIELEQSLGREKKPHSQQLLDVLLERKGEMPTEFKYQLIQILTISEVANEIKQLREVIAKRGI